MTVPVKYRTIVADPPWPYPEGWPVGSINGRAGQTATRRGEAFDVRRRKPLPYPSMMLAEIAAVPISELAQTDAHLYVWTTNRYLRDTFALIDGWGFRFSTALAWCKTPMGLGPGGTFAQNMEFVLFARRGSLANTAKSDTRWWNWPRMGNAHSRKPDAFLDLVESVSPGPYLELFARRQRLGWDTWGNEALEHVTMAEATS